MSWNRVLGHDLVLHFPALQKFIPRGEVQRDPWGVVRIDLPIPGRECRSASRPQMHKLSPQIQPEELAPEQKSQLQILEICLD